MIKFHPGEFFAPTKEIKRNQGNQTNSKKDWWKTKPNACGSKY